MIYATDLDRTVIFSYKFLADIIDVPHRCVEFRGDREISYMTEKAIKKLSCIKNNNSIVLIPTTTRSIEQYKNISIFNDCEYAITTNGGVILHNGVPMTEWSEKVKTLLGGYDYEYLSLKDKLEDLKEDFFNSDIILVDSIFYYAKIKIEKMRELLVKLDGLLDKGYWSWVIQGGKLSVIPKKISKESAVLWLKDNLKCDFLITSGDGPLDKGLLKTGDVCVIPEKSSILECDEPVDFDYLSVPSGPKGVEILFDIVLDFVQ